MNEIGNGHERGLQIKSTLISFVFILCIFFHPCPELKICTCIKSNVVFSDKCAEYKSSSFKEAYLFNWLWLYPFDSKENSYRKIVRDGPGKHNNIWPANSCQGAAILILLNKYKYYSEPKICTIQFVFIPLLPLFTPNFEQICMIKSVQIAGCLVTWCNL